MSFIGTTIEGLEEAAEKETIGKTIAPGRVEFESCDKEYLTLDKIYEYTEKYTFTSLADLLKQIKKTDIVIKDACTLLCTRRGEHKFNSITAKEGVRDILKEKGIDYNPKEPQTTLVIDIIENICLLGILIKKKPGKTRL